MEQVMKAVAVLEEGVVDIVEVPVPQYGPYTCLVRNRACGFCSSTDLKIIHNSIADMQVQYPTILGHEGAGEIIAVGEKVRNFKVGDRVTCARGVCIKGTPYTFTWGEMAQYTIAHDVYAMTEDGIDLEKETPGKTLTTYPVRKIPDGITYPDAVMILTFEENYSALLNFGLQPGMDLLIFGDGTVAQGLAFFAQLLGARSICCVGHHNEKLEKMKVYSGVDFTVNTRQQAASTALQGRRFDMVIDAVGSIDVIRDGFRHVKDNGKVCVYGVLKREQANLNLFDMANHSSLHLLTWPHDEHRVHEEIVRLIRTKILRPSDFYSHVLPMDEIQYAIELVKTRAATKVILDMA